VLAAESTAAAREIAGQVPLAIDQRSLPDGRLPVTLADLKATLELLKPTQPDLILCPRRDDAHQDHRTIAEVVWQTFRSHLVLEYEIPKYDGDLVSPQLYVELPEAIVARKIELLQRCFPSQRDRSWFSEEVFRGVLRLRGLEVTTFGRTPRPYLNAELLDAIGARYVNTADQSITETARASEPFDLIFEGTGSSAVVFESMQVLAKNGALVLTSITGGNHVLEVPADRINLEFVLGNKVMVGSVNASRENFETGVRDLSQAEAEYPGWLGRLLTDPVRGLDNFRDLFARLQNPSGAIKIFCEVSPS